MFGAFAYSQPYFAGVLQYAHVTPGSAVCAVGQYIPILSFTGSSVQSLALTGASVAMLLGIASYVHLLEKTGSDIPAIDVTGEQEIC